MTSYSTFQEDNASNEQFAMQRDQVPSSSSPSAFSSSLEEEEAVSEEEEEEEEAFTESELPSSSTTPTKSQIIFIKFVFYTIGCGFLLPWNSFISAESYFLSRFIPSCPSELELNARNDVNNYSNSKDGSNFMSWLGLLYNLSGVFALIYLLFKSQKNQEPQQQQEQQLEQQQVEWYEIFSPHEEDGNKKKKSKQWKVIVTSLCIYLLIMIITSIFVLIPSFNNNDNTIQLFRVLTFICIIMSGTNGAFLSSNIVSYANIHFPPLYSIQCYVSGQAVGGVAISILNVLLDYFVDGKNEDIFWKDQCSNETVHENIYIQKDSYDSAGNRRLLSCHDYSYDWGAFSYFVTSCFFLIMCIILFIKLDSSSIIEYYRIQRMKDSSREMESNNNIDHETSSNINDTNTTQSSSRIDIYQSRSDVLDIEELIDDNIELSTDRSPSLQEPLLKGMNDEQEVNSNVKHLVDGDNDARTVSYVWKIIQSPVTSIFITFFITLTIFPSWTGILTSTLKCQSGSSRLRNDLFTPFIVVLFNVFDLIGRISSGIIMDIISRNDTFSLISKKISVLSMSRFIFLPAFYLCQNNVYKTDTYIFMVMILFAFSNGVASNLSFIHAATLLNANPQDSNDEQVQSIASSLLNFAVGLGLLAGSVFSFAYNYFGLVLM